MNPWRRRPNEPPAPDDSISLEDIEWRIGASEARPQHEGGEGEDAEATSVWIGEEEAAAAAAAAGGAGAGAAPAGRPAERLSADDAAAAEGAAAAASGAAAAPGLSEFAPRPRRKPSGRRAASAASTARVSARRSASTKPHAHPVVGVVPRRLTLWRDVSALLFGAVAIVLIAQLAIGNRGETAVGTSSPGTSSEPTDVAVIETGTPAPTSERSIGPVIDPSLIPVIEATPTPVPIITLPPTPVPTAAPRITPRPTVRPVATPKPTVKPSVAPTPVVTPAPTAAPPVAKITADQTCGGSPITVAFDASGSTGATSWSWDFDDGTTGSGETISHTFTATVSQTQFSVILTVTGPGGSDPASMAITAGPCP